ncbi:MAG: hypothetical protein FWG44_00565 [Oscillospiraceae bacterium]|nr:hypothetical protein [Oscillospiraceae bacterium]
MNSKTKFKISATQEFTKNELLNKISDINQPHFLLDVYQYILNNRPDNRVGRATYEDWCPVVAGAKSNSKRPFTNGPDISLIHREINITRDINEINSIYQENKIVRISENNYTKKGLLDIINAFYDDWKKAEIEL